MKIKKLFNIIRLLEHSKSVLIVSHVNPEADAIGSCLALGLYLKDFCNVKIYNEQGVPEELKFLPFSEKIQTQIPHEYIDVLVVLDCADKDRMGTKIQQFNNFGVSINIDHHVSNTNFGDINFINPAASSVGEIMYMLLSQGSKEVTKDICTNLYAAILTDTGGFRYSNTTSNTFEIAAKLIKKGVCPSDISKNCFNYLTKEGFELLVKTLSTTTIKNNVAVMKLPYKNFKKELKYQMQMFIDILNLINDVEVSVFIKEVEQGKCRVSLRSKNRSVSDIAQRYGGGGHNLAAGFSYNGDIEVLYREIMNLFENA